MLAPFDPSTLPGLELWLESRFPGGLSAPNLFPATTADASNAGNIGQNGSAAASTYGLDTVTPISGTSSYRATNVQAAGVGQGVVITNCDLPVRPGEVVTFQATVRNSRGILTLVAASFRGPDPARAPVTELQSAAVLVGTVPTDMAITATAPAGSAFVRLKAYWNEATLVGDTIAVDNLAASYGRYPAGTAVPYQAAPADGSTVSSWKDLSGKGRHADQGTVANRPLWRVGRKANALAAYGIADGSGTGGLFSNGATAAFSVDTSGKISGANSIQVLCTASAAQIGLAWNQSGIPTPARPGEIWTLAAKVLKGVGNGNVDLQLIYRDAAGAALATHQQVGVVISGGAVVQASVTSTRAPANTAWVTGKILWSGTPAVGDLFYVDDADLVQEVNLTGAGQPVLQFAPQGANYTPTLLNTPAFSLPRPYTVYMVWRPQVNDQNPANGVWGVATQEADWAGVYASAALNPPFFSGFVNVANLGSGNPARNVDGALHVHTHVSEANPANSSFDQDGVNTSVTQTPVGATAPNAQVIRIGTDGGLGRPVIGEVMAVLMFSRAHDATTQRAIQGYLAETFGVAAVPSKHTAGAIMGTVNVTATTTMAGRKHALSGAIAHAVTAALTFVGIGLAEDEETRAANFRAQQKRRVANHEARKRSLQAPPGPANATRAAWKPLRDLWDEMKGGGA